MAHRSRGWDATPRRASTRDRDHHCRATNTHSIKRAKQRSSMRAKEIRSAILSGRATHVGYGKNGKNEIWMVLQGEGAPPVYGVLCPRTKRLVTVLTEKHISRRYHVTLFKDTA